MTNDNETLIAVAAWGSWCGAVPAGSVLVQATRGGNLGEKDKKYYSVPEHEYAFGPGIRFAIDTARHAEIHGFQGTGSKVAASAAKPAITSGARPWSEILKALGFAKPAGSPGAATIGNLQSPTRTASSPARPEPEQSTPAGRARPWAEVLRQIEAEERAR